MRNLRKKVACTIVILISCLCMAHAALALQPLSNISLRLGSEGEDVLLLQQNLVELQLYSATPDGIYNAKTAVAVRSLQEFLGQPADGICGIQTAQAFNAALASGSIPLPQKQPLPLSGYSIGIDAGHQKTPDTAQESVSPHSKTMKPRMSEGGIGVKTGIPEYEVTLQIAKKLQAVLENAGATVVMTRTKHDVSLSNAERAQLMNGADVDFWVRIHCDASNNSKNKGVSILVPSPETAPDIAKASLALAKEALPAICKETEAKQIAVTRKADQTAFNWSQVPVITVEFGFLSNPTEDVLLNRSAYQTLCVKGLYTGIIQYTAALVKE